MQRRRAQASGLVHFGPFGLDLDTAELFRDGNKVPLRPLASRALVALARHPERLVTRETLRQELWGDTAVEWSAGLHQVVRQIRKAMDDDERRYVETVSRRGYRLRVAVQPVVARRRLRTGLENARLYALGVATPVALIVLFLIVCALLAQTPAP